MSEEYELIATGNILFVCPQCGKPTLSIHRKTYERSIIVFCTNCHLHSTYIPTKDAYYDTQLAYKEYLAKRHSEPSSQLML
ncbi:MAG TPA: hypothetical protein VLH35_02630 [Candidatus Acidoferrales bacterium]|nr:hypothetical protein [Candidatus Acidoferrales bacterium]